jgi:hypothetical protein
MGKTPFFATPAVVLDEFVPVLNSSEIVPAFERGAPTLKAASAVATVRDRKDRMGPPRISFKNFDLAGPEGGTIQDLIGIVNVDTSIHGVWASLLRPRG